MTDRDDLDERDDLCDNPHAGQMALAGCAFVVFASAVLLLLVLLLR